MRPPRVEQSVPGRLQLQQDPAGRNLPRAVPERLHKPAPVHPGPGKLRHQRDNHRTARETVRSHMVRQAAGSVLHRHFQNRRSNPERTLKILDRIHEVPAATAPLDQREEDQRRVLEPGLEAGRAAENRRRVANHGIPAEPAGR